MQDRVVVYSQNGCPACEQAKRWLAEHGVPFDVRNLDDRIMRAVYIQELHALGVGDGAGMPVVVWGKDKPAIVGYSPMRLEARYGYIKSLEYIDSIEGEVE